MVAAIVRSPPAALKERSASGSAASLWSYSATTSARLRCSARSVGLTFAFMDVVSLRRGKGGAACEAAPRMGSDVDGVEVAGAPQFAETGRRAVAASDHHRDGGALAGCRNLGAIGLEGRLRVRRALDLDGS